MAQESGDVRSPNLPPRSAAGAGAMIVVGVVFAAYGAIGAAFVEGGVEHGDPSVSRGGVYFLAFLASVGIALIVCGFRRRMRKA